MPGCFDRREFLANGATAGLDFHASVTLPDYDGGVWSALLVLRGPSVIDLTATSSGTAFAFAAAGAVTAAWLPGSYWYSLRVFNSASKLELQSGEMTVAADLEAAPAGYNGQTENEIALAAIKAVLAKRATLDQDRYRINNRELYRTSIADLLKLRTNYVAVVRRERAAASKDRRFGRLIRVNF